VPIELRPLGRVPEPLAQRPDRVFLTDVLGEVLVDELAERGEDAATESDGVATPKRSDLVELRL
jgi:hypothetical protein